MSITVKVENGDGSQSQSHDFTTLPSRPFFFPEQDLDWTPSGPYTPSVTGANVTLSIKSTRQSNGIIQRFELQDGGSGDS